MICVDAGYDPWTVYDYVMAYPDFLRPTKGASHQLPVLYRTTIIEKNKATGHSYPGGLVLWVLNTLMLKDKILRLQGGGPPKAEAPDTAGSTYTGGWHLPEDLPPDYLLQVTNEERKFERNRKTGKGRWAWVPKYSGAPTHYFDCEALALAAADMLGVGSGELDPPPAEKKIIRAGASDSAGFRSRPKRGWMSWK
jgi:phage terminase large subunit GpA-like protein